MNDINERRFIADVMKEHARALAKFPGPNVNLAALTEEAGELVEALAGYLLNLQVHHGRLARALLHHRPEDVGDGTWDQVRKEAVQVAVMAMRVALEGDMSLAVPPADYVPSVVNRADDAERERNQPEIRFNRFPTGSWKAVPSSGPIAGVWDLSWWTVGSDWTRVRNGVSMSELIGVVLNVRLPAGGTPLTDQQARDIAAAESNRADDAARQALQDARDANPLLQVDMKTGAVSPVRPVIQLRIVPGEPGYLLTQARIADHTGENYWMHVANSDSIVTAHKAGEEYVNRRRDGATFVWVPYDKPAPVPQMDPVEYVVKDGVKVATTRPPAVQPFDEAQPGGICHTGHEWRFQGKGDGSKRCERCGVTAPTRMSELTNLQQKELATAYSTDRPAVVADDERDEFWEQRKIDDPQYARDREAANAADVSEPDEPKPVTWTCKITQHGDGPGFDVWQWNGKKWTIIAGDLPGPYARGVLERRMREAGLHIETDDAAANPDLRKGVIKKLRDVIHANRTHARFILSQLSEPTPDLQAIRRYAENILDPNA